MIAGKRTSFTVRATSKANHVTCVFILQSVQIFGETSRISFSVTQAFITGLSVKLLNLCCVKSMFQLHFRQSEGLFYLFVK